MISSFRNLRSGKEVTCMISTRGRYALRVMLELAKGDPDQWISLDSIAQTQHMSKKYLESIIRSLAADGYVQGQRGKGGGYRLLRKPEDIRLSEILRSAEGSLESVACLRNPDYVCDRKAECETLPLWIRFDGMVNDFFDGLTLQDLVDGNI